jgi:hypothetical protein
MTPQRRLLLEALKVTLATYIETRRRSRDDLVNALKELRRYLPKLIADGIDDRTQLVVKGLIRLRELEQRPRALPMWMRRRIEIGVPAEQRMPSATNSVT